MRRPPSMHSPAGARHADLGLLLVRGNHDHQAGDPPDWLRAQVVDEPFALGGLSLCHHPRPRPGCAVVAGHLHPCLTIEGRARDRLRLPCLHIQEGVAVLPAFGAFTGMHAIERRAGDRVWVVADGQVAFLPSPPAAGVEVPPSAGHATGADGGAP